MQKDSLCEKRKYTKRKKKEQLIEQPAIEDEIESVEDEIESDEIPAIEDDGYMLDRLSGDDRDAEYVDSIFEEEEDKEEAEEEAKKREAEQRKKIRRDNKTINYVNADEMEKQIREYYDTDVMSEELALNIRKICDRLSMSSRFVNYTYREEMVGDAFLSAYKAIYKKKYKLGLGFSPFSYVTQVAYHSMVQRIKTEHKEREKTDAYREAYYDDFLKETISDQNAANEGFDSYDG